MTLRALLVDVGGTLIPVTQFASLNDSSANGAFRRLHVIPDIWRHSAAVEARNDMERLFGGIARG